LELSKWKCSLRQAISPLVSVPVGQWTNHAVDKGYIVSDFPCYNKFAGANSFGLKKTVSIDSVALIV
jgi:hypothetical protein